MLPRFVLLLLLLASGRSLAQVSLDWQPRADVNATLPPSIRVFESITPTIPAWYVRADPADLGWRLQAVLSARGTETVPSFASGAEALVAVNGGYFGGGQSFSLVRDGGQTFSSNIAALTRSGSTFYPTRGAFGVSDSRVPDVAWVYDVMGIQTAYNVPNANREGASPEPRPTAQFPAGARPWNAVTAIGGGPVLVEDGAVRLTWEEEVFFGGSGVDLTSMRARTAVGYDASGHLLVLVADETRGLTLGELAAAMVDLGAVEALNLDGGGSSAMVASGVTLRSTGRAVASALMIVPASGAAETVLDTESAAYAEEGAWFNSSNTPYYGESPARLLQIEAEGRAVYRFDGIEPGLYQIDAWWVPSPNRAQDTPYTLYHEGETMTVRVNQSDPQSSGQWNTLLTTELAPGDSLVVTTDATSGSPVTTFVCVDAVRLTNVTPPATETAPERPLALRVSPNPARGSLRVTFAMPEPGPAQIDLIDVLGRVVRQRREAFGGRDARVAFGLEGLAPGIYTVRVLASGVADRAQVTVVR